MGGGRGGTASSEQRGLRMWRVQGCAHAATRTPRAPEPQPVTQLQRQRVQLWQLDVRGDVQRQARPARARNAWWWQRARGACYPARASWAAHPVGQARAPRGLGTPARCAIMMCTPLCTAWPLAGLHGCTRCRLRFRRAEVAAVARACTRPAACAPQLLLRLWTQQPVPRLPCLRGDFLVGAMRGCGCCGVLLCKHIAPARSHALPLAPPGPSTPLLQHPVVVVVHERPLTAFETQRPCSPQAQATLALHWPVVATPAVLIVASTRPHFATSPAA